MKKVYIIFLLVFSLFTSKSYAINWDNLINNFISIPSLNTEIYNVPDWFDLYVEKASVNVSLWWSTDIEVYDWSNLSYKWEFPEWFNIWEYNLVFRDSLEIRNLGWKDADIIYYWYLFKEWTNLSIWIDWNISENWWIIPDAEFMRQDELYQFYELELNLTI
jgi:hypothetical protein